MLEFAIFLACVFAYTIGFSWMRSYIIGLNPNDADKFELGTIAAVLWPVIMIGVIIRPACIYFSTLGTKMSERDVLTRKFRIKAEERLRVEQERLEEEVEREIEETLRNSSKR